MKTTVKSAIATLMFVSTLVLGTTPPAFANGPNLHDFFSSLQGDWVKPGLPESQFFELEIILQGDTLYITGEACDMKTQTCGSTAEMIKFQGNEIISPEPEGIYVYNVVEFTGRKLVYDLIRGKIANRKTLELLDFETLKRSSRLVGEGLNETQGEEQFDIMKRVEKRSPHPSHF